MSFPPGWYPDSAQAGQLRYWNGAAWTEDRAPSGTKPTVADATHHKSIGTQSRKTEVPAVANRPFARFLAIGLGLVLVAWVILGMVTGKWTDDDYKNRQCSQVSEFERLCRDNDTGELVPSD